MVFSAGIRVHVKPESAFTFHQNDCSRSARIRISDITAETGLTTGGIYKAYKDKKGVYAKALERYVLLREESMKARIEKASDGKEKITVLLKDYD